MKLTKNDERIPIGDRVSIVRRGKRGLWTAEFRHDGEHCRESLKTSNKKLAIQRAIKLEHELATGCFRPTPKPMTICQASTCYIEWLKSEGRQENTIVRYRGELETFQEFCEATKALRLSHITPSLMDAYRAERHKTHHRNTVYHETMLIKQFCRWLESDDDGHSGCLPDSFHDPYLVW